MKCPFCGTKNKFRVNLYQSVDCEVDENFYPINTGFDFTEIEMNEEDVWCGACGESMSLENILRISKQAFVEEKKTNLK